jgi:hypothetical protein
MKIWISPTGRIAKGNVLDCAVGPLERALRDYDPQLYFRWNAKKLKGWGCWELRRRPDNKKVVETAVFEGNTIVRVEYKENNFENHVKDFAFLNYSALKWVQDHDAWKYGHKGRDFMKEAEYREAKFDEREEDRAVNELEYNLKQHKSEIRAYRDHIASGGNPYDLADHWGK